jgi:hypothetical protein
MPENDALCFSGCALGGLPRRLNSRSSVGFEVEGATDAPRLIGRGRWDGTEMLDLRGEVFPRMGVFVLGFQGGGERSGSELRR